MKKKKYQKPKFAQKTFKVNFFSSRFNFKDGDLLTRYCGQCGTCAGCGVPSGCDAVSC